MKPDVSYFMGQGKVYFAPRQANGAIIGGWKFVGDCEALQISNNQTFDDIAENTSGNRAIAAHIPTGSTQGFRGTMRQWTIANLVRAAYGAESANIAAGSVTAELLTAYGASVSPLANPGVSTVVPILGGGAAKVASVGVTVAGTGGTPGAVLPVTFTGGTPTTAAAANAIINAAGGIDHIEMTNYGAGYGSAPTADVTGITGETLVVNMGGTALTLNTDYTVDAAMGSIEWLAGSTKVPNNAVPLTGSGLGTPISVNYAYESWVGKVEALTQGIREYAVMFLGMNTANDRAPVRVFLWRVSLNLARVLDLIMARSGSLEMDGMLLPAADRNGTTQSQFYTIEKV